MTQPPVSGGDGMSDIEGRVLRLLLGTDTVELCECVECRALVLPDALDEHVNWHITLGRQLRGTWA